MVKTFENLRKKQMAYDLETIYAALGTGGGGGGVYQVCSNDDPWLTMTYFTARSNSVT